MELILLGIFILIVVMLVVKKIAYKRLTDEEKEIYKNSKNKARDISKKRFLFPIIGMVVYVICAIVFAIIVYTTRQRAIAEATSQHEMFEQVVLLEPSINRAWDNFFTITQVYIIVYFVAREIYEIILKRKINKSNLFDEKEKNLLTRFYVISPTKFIFYAFLAEFIPTVVKIINQVTAYKPIIYIYPEKKQKVTIKVDKPVNLTHTYPKYNDGWSVEADVDGTLIDETGRKYYSLYWEGISNIKVDEKIGFCVKGEDTVKFLEEKLEFMGLNYKEAEEFIVYWLPQMENNKYNYVYFVQNKDVDSMMKLDIEPKPETLIRIMMYFKPLNKEVELQEQQLVSTQRSGYTIVEWGGTKIK